MFFCVLYSGSAHQNQMLKVDGVATMEEFSTFEIDLLFDKMTMKLTGTVLQKPTWLKEKDYLPPVEFRDYGGICFKFKDMNHMGVFSL